MTTELALSTRLEPLDDHDQRLLDHVHPRDWKNPAPKSRYHLVVLGGGPGGLVASAIGASLGANVALVEKALLGGDCLNVGCVPSKAMIRAAASWREARHSAEEFGGPRVLDASGDFSVVMDRVRRLRADLSPVDAASRYRDELGVDVFLGSGHFVGPSTIAVGDSHLNFRRAIVSTGSRAFIPRVPGLDDVDYLTNETIFSLTKQPAHLLVIGGGPIGSELAQAFARLGSAVTLVQDHERLLPREDPEAAKVVEAALERDGVDLRRGADIRQATSCDNAVALTIRRNEKTEHIVGDRLLVAAGRKPNIENLGLDAAGIEYDEKGIRADDRLRTSNRRVFVVGDVASRHKFTHAADAQARIAVQNALFFGRGKASRQPMSWATYTSPEVAHVGMSVDEAAEHGIAIDTVTVPLDDVDRAVLEGTAEGFLRVHLKKGTDRIVGATLVAEHAGDMIGEIAVAMTAGIGLEGVGRTIHPYPTQGEVFRKAADAWRRRKLTPRIQRVFEIFFSVLR